MSEYDEVLEEMAVEAGVLELKPLRTYRYCGLNERSHDTMLCGALRIKSKETGRYERVRCGYLNEAGGCDFITKEQKIVQEKAEKEAAEDAEEERRSEEIDKQSDSDN